MTKKEIRFGLQEEQVAEIKYLANKTDLKQKDIAYLYPTTVSNISYIKRNKTWKDVEPKQPDNLDDIIKEIEENKIGFGRNKASEVKWLALNSEITHREIANKYGTSISNVSKIKHNKTWKDVEPQKPKK